MKYQNEISTYSFRKAISFLVIVFLQLPFAFGQGAEVVEVHFETDSVVVEKGSTFTNFLVIKNSGTEEITIQDIAPQEKYPGLIFYPKADFTLAAGAQKRLPIKFIANLDFLKRQSDEIIFVLSYKSFNATTSQSASFYIQKEEDKSLAIYAFSRENYIDPSTPESAILIFVENRGYSNRSIKLDFQSLPDGLEITPKQQTLSLEGREKRMVEIKVSVRRQNTLFPDYNIQVKATDLIDNENVGSSNIKVVVLSHNRQIARGIGSGRGNNFAEIAYNQNSSGLNYLKLRGNTEFPVTENLYGRFNLTTDYYLQDGLYNLYDTWLELERENTVLRIGNVYGSDYDYSVSGRGGKIATKIGAHDEIEVLALENNYNLYGTYFPQREGSKMAGAKYSFGDTKTFNGKVSYLFDHDPRLSTDSHVANFASSFSLNNRHNFRTEAGLSHESGWINKDENTGALVGLNYDSNVGDWDFQSYNSYATPSYAGLYRGSFNLNQRIGHQISSNNRVFLFYQNSQVQPEYLSIQNAETVYPSSDYFHSTQSAQVGYQFTIQNWNFLLSPQIDKQKIRSNFNMHELLSYRFNTNIGTTFGSHGLNLNTAYSYSKKDDDMDWFHGFRSVMSYRYKGFSLNGSAQWNPINVIDLNAYNNTDRDFVNYNLYASYYFHALNKNLTGSFSAGTYYSELYENMSQNLTGNLEYKISTTWSATGYFNYSDYRSIQTEGYGGSNYQFRVGLKKYFTVATSIGKHKVSFQLFEDKNFNGILDIDEAVLGNEVVKLDNYVAITDKNGKVTFQNVPKGSYKLKVNESAGSRLMMDPVIEVDKNINRNVGLVKNIKVIGKLMEVKQPYDILETDPTGILVYARNNDGDIQTTVVNQNKEFEFFLKDGKYDIYIENDKYSYINPKQTIEVDKEDYAENLLFEYKKKDTTIKVKKF